MPNIPVTPHLLHLAAAPLKQVLGLFAPDTPLHIQALGDILHPSDGYVDATLVNGVALVNELLAFPYDFAGLVCFEAVVADVTINYHGSNYQLVGPPKTLQQLLARLRTLNSQSDAPPLIMLDAV